MTEDLKARLAKIDPAKLEAGPETDALVAEILGIPIEPWHISAYCNRFPKISAGKELLLFCHENDRGREWIPSEEPGLAFSVLWPWLLGHCQEIELKKDSLWVLSDGENPDGTGYYQCLSCDNGNMSLEFCRAVVAVAKGGLVGVEVIQGGKSLEIPMKVGNLQQGHCPICGAKLENEEILLYCVHCDAFFDKPKINP